MRHERANWNSKKKEKKRGINASAKQIDWKVKKKLSDFRRRTFPRLWDSHEGNIQYSLGNILCHKLHYYSRKGKTFDRNTPWWKSQILEKFSHQQKGKWKWKQSDVFPNLQEHQLATKPWKGPSVFHSQGLSSCKSLFCLPVVLEKQGKLNLR